MNGILESTQLVSAASWSHKGPVAGRWRTQILEDREHAVVIDLFLRDKVEDHCDHIHFDQVVLALNDPFFVKLIGVHIPIHDVEVFLDGFFVGMLNVLSEELDDLPLILIVN